MCNPAQHNGLRAASPELGAPGAALSSAGQALSVLNSALAYLTDADPAGLTVAEQAECLRGLQRAESVRIAAQSAVLGAFEASSGHAADGHGTARSWLRWQARITGSAAGAAVAWTRRLAAHPALHDALAAGQVSESWARQIAEWTDLLPPSARPDADVILVAAAAAGADLPDLAGLAEEMRARTCPPDGDGDDPPDRGLRLDLHYRGAGRLRGDLTPRCAAAVQAVLDALGKKVGREDRRTRAQRDHDALEEACHRLIAAGLLPDRDGQPTKILLHMNLTDLLGQAPDTPAQPGARPAASEGHAAHHGSTDQDAAADQDSAAGQAEVARRRLYPSRDDLTSPWPGGFPGPGPLARPGDLCDASIQPVVTGHVDHEFLARLAQALIAADPRPLITAGPAALRTPPGSNGPGVSGSGVPGLAGVRPGDGLADQYARDLILRGAVALLSGPGGLASRLRTGTLTGPAASISLPLDLATTTDTIPAHLRRAVFLRDRHCSFPGCENPHCQVHHLIPRSQGGPTRLDHLALYCLFHHLIAIHEWGWKVILNADGTTTATSPDGRHVLHSHSPPRAA